MVEPTNLNHAAAIAVTVGFGIIPRTGTQTVSGKIRYLVDNVGLALSVLTWAILWTCLRLNDETSAASNV
jgi:hypothetical protein